METLFTISKWLFKKPKIMLCFRKGLKNKSEFNHYLGRGSAEAIYHFFSLSKNDF